MGKVLVVYWTNLAFTEEWQESSFPQTMEGMQKTCEKGFFWTFYPSYKILYRCELTLHILLNSINQSSSQSFNPRHVTSSLTPKCEKQKDKCKTRVYVQVKTDWTKSNKTNNDNIENKMKNHSIVLSEWFSSAGVGNLSKVEQIWLELNTE